ncbi:MAG TPA: NAD-dependent epimerase/dehydratase family protein [Longimicrobiaceae bacterium]|nr:NAD-dependent epimerase/dehydratase family protein [Longimicrobiaceae bacterium]
MTSVRGPVLVTGATGFLGRQLSAALAAEGIPVRGLVRDPAARLPDGVEPAPAAGLHDREALRRALDGAQAVVHLAARVHVMRDAAADPLTEFRRVNVEGTRVLLEEAVSAGVRSFVFVSSVKAVGEESDAPWTEDTPPRPVDPYGISKLEAERLVREMADRAGLHAPILRLPLVYGPGVKGNMLQLFALVSRGVPLPFGAVPNRRSMVYSGNVVAAIRAVLDSPAAGSGVFFVSDGRDLTTPELVREVARALGVEPRLLRVPPALLHVAARAGDVLSRVAPFPLTSPALQRLTGSLALDASELGRVTGFRPPYSVEEGLRATAEWYRAGDAARA